MIGHIDADCFYVSAERVRFPHLQGMPVAIIGNHGACIIAKSYEMKAAGVKTGMPIWDAVPICPQAVYMKRDFTWYEVLSRKMLAIVQNASPLVEFYSIDEQFSKPAQPTQTAPKLAKRNTPASPRSGQRGHCPHQNPRQVDQRFRQTLWQRGRE